MADLGATFDMSKFLQLRTLCFFGMCFTREEPYNKIQKISLFLSTVTQACKLRTVDIQTYIGLAKGDEVDWECWRQIDDILSDLSLFPALRTLTISLIINDLRYADNIVALLEQQLPTILGRGYLSVSITC